MAHPWVFQENFESGDKGNFDGTTVDGGGALSFLHWKRLRALPGAPMPYRGAYLPQIDLSAVDSSGTYFLEDTTFDHATTDVTRYIRFYLYITSDLTMAASDIFDIFQIRSAAAAEVTFSIRSNAGVIEIGVGETAGATRTRPITLGEWHCVEATMLLAVDGGGDGTIDFFVDGTQVGAQIESLTQTTTTNARLGVQNIDAGTTAGRIYFDQIVYDDARVYPLATRKPRQIIVTDSEHIFVGPGNVSSATLLTTGASNTMVLYDTDTATTTDATSRIVELDLTTHTSVDGPYYFEKGCYAVLAGTAPRGQVTVDLESARPHIYPESAWMRNYAS